MSRSWPFSLFTELYLYQTTKLVTFQRTKIGIIYRIIQLGIIMYFSVYLMWYEKNYQVFYNGVSTSMLKLKGITTFYKVKTHGKAETLSQTEFITLDSLDHHKSISNTNIIVVPTRIVRTKNQTMKECRNPNHECESDNDCPTNLSTFYGTLTGVCESLNDKNYCKINGWCPIEGSENTDVHSINPSEVAQLGNLTIFVKITAFFRFFDIAINNIPDSMNVSTLANCRYNASDPENRNCPIFYLRDVIPMFDNVGKTIVKKGTEIIMFVDWLCNFDYDSKYCFPDYFFLPLDSDANSARSGYNTRYISSQKNGEDYSKVERTIFKVYGIKITVIGGKLDLVNAILHIGSGIALLGTSSFICDLLIFYLVPKKEFYKSVATEYYNSEMTKTASTFVKNETGRKVESA